MTMANLQMRHSSVAIVKETFCFLQMNKHFTLIKASPTSQSVVKTAVLQRRLAWMAVEEVAVVEDLVAGVEEETEHVTIVEDLVI
jgi:hypothetical protein